MFPTIKPSTTLMVFVLFYISTSSLQVVRAVPEPVFGPGLKALEARQEGRNDTFNSTTPLPDFKKQNGLDAQNLNKIFKTWRVTDLCQDGTVGCIDSRFARCTGSKWFLTPCPSGSTCFALPLPDDPGTVVMCEIPSQVEAMFKAIGMAGGLDGSSDANGEGYCDPAGYPDDDCDCVDDGPGPPSSMPVPPLNGGITSTTTTPTLTQSPTPT